MKIDRGLFSILLDQLKSDRNKVILIFGARQVGKTTLVKEVLKNTDLNFRIVIGDDQSYHRILSSRNTTELLKFIDGFDGLFIDEAQKIPEIGINLKIIHDQRPELKIIATGSAPLDLASKTREALTGRHISYQLYPVSISDLQFQYNRFDIENSLPSLLVYGSYPEVINLGPSRERESYLHSIGQDYLYKDVLELLTLREGHKMQNLLKLLAFQIGSEVSMSELALNLEMDKETVSRYIDLLEKSFVILRLSGFSRNLRKEVRKMDKLYFCDLGIRNAVINNFNSLENRNDVGALWENFCIIERQKTLDYQMTSYSPYFWRTYTGAEFDYLEERGGHLHGYELKWGRKKVRPPKTFLDTYDNSSFSVVQQDNFYDFVLDKNQDNNQQLDL